MTRRLITLALIAVSALLSGCLVIAVVDDEDGEQRDLIGDVTLTTTTCPTAFPPINPTPDDPVPCYDEDDVLEALDDGDLISLPHQVLVAFRVPKGATAPATLSTQVRVAGMSGVPFTVFNELRARGRKARTSRLLGPVDPTLFEREITFRRAPEMQDQMKQFYGGEFNDGPFSLPDDAEVLGDDQEIVGYVSEPVPGAIVNKMKLTGDFGLPKGADGKPFTGPFNHQSFAGLRIAFPDEIFLPIRARAGRGLGGNPFDPDRPVDCSFEDEGTSLCPLPNIDLATGSLQDALKGIDLLTRDLTIAQGAYGSGRQGETATVPFKLLGAGPIGGGDLALSATTTIPGGTATPRDTALSFPGAGEHEQPVTVTIPEGTAPGEYQVELVAKVGDQLRAAVGLVTVVAKEVPLPELPEVQNETKPDRLFVENSGRIAFGYICETTPSQCGNSEGVYYQNPATIQGLKAAAAQGKKFRMHRLGRKRFGAKQGTRVRVKLKLYRSARRATRKGKTIKGLLVVRSGGKSTKPTVRRVVISKKRR